MYGTVMIGTLTESARSQPEQVLSELEQWETERHVKGYRDSWLMIADDGQTLVESVRFESKADYEELGQDPEQDRWWRERMRPLLTDEPRWIDGTWLER